MDYRYLDYETLSSIKSLEIRARLLVEGFFAGFHKSPFKGFSVEFSEYRMYQPGDDIRSIDWRAYARTDRLYVKEFEEETNLRFYILLDSSASMAYKGPEGDGVSKYDYAATAAASLAYLAALQRDAVGLITFGEGLRGVIPPRTGLKHLHAILSQMQNVEPEGETEIYDILAATAERVPRRALFAMFTDLWDDPERVATGLSALKGKKHDIILFQILDPAEEDFPFQEMSRFVDMENGDTLQLDAARTRGGYLEAFDDFVSEYRAELGESNIDFIPLTTATPPGQALLNYLGKRSKLI
ncbi:MAG: DUF58 domain-containing protein [bacterium]|nr:DUF58 domain-containing protein [bacterium]